MFSAGANKGRKQPADTPNTFLNDVVVKPLLGSSGGQNNVSRGNSPDSGFSGRPQNVVHTSGMSKNVNSNNASPNRTFNITTPKVNTNRNVNNKSPANSVANRSPHLQSTTNTFQVFTYGNKTEHVEEPRFERPKRVHTKFKPVKFKRIKPVIPDYTFKTRYGFQEEERESEPRSMPPDLLARRKDTTSNDESARERLRHEGVVDSIGATKRQRSTKNRNVETCETTENEVPSKGGKETVMNVTLVSLHMPPRKSTQNVTAAQEPGFGAINSNESVNPELNTLLAQLNNFISNRQVDNKKLVITQPPRVLVEDVVRGSEATVSAPKRIGSKSETTDTEQHTKSTTQPQNMSIISSQPSDIKTRRSTHHKHKDDVACDIILIKPRDGKCSHRTPSGSSLEEKKVSKTEARTTHHKHKQSRSKLEVPSDAMPIKPRGRYKTHPIPSESSLEENKVPKTKERSAHHKQREELSSISIKPQERQITQRTPSDASVNSKKVSKTKERSTHHKQREEVSSISIKPQEKHQTHRTPSDASVDNKKVSKTKERSTHHKHREEVSSDTISIKPQERHNTHRTPSDASVDNKKVPKTKERSTHHKHREEVSSDTISIKPQERHNTHRTPSDASVDNKKVPKTKERSTHHKHREEVPCYVYKSKSSMNRKLASEMSISSRSINSTIPSCESGAEISGSRIIPKRRMSSVSFYEPEKTKHTESRRTANKIQHKSHGPKDRTQERPNNRTQDIPKYKTHNKTKPKPSLSEDLSSHFASSFVDNTPTKDSILTTMTANTDSESNAFKSHKKFKGGDMSSHKQRERRDETKEAARYRKEKEALRENTKFNQKYGLTSVYNVQSEGGRGCLPDSTPKKHAHRDKEVNERRSANSHRDKEEGCGCNDRKSSGRHRTKICGNTTSSADSAPDPKTLKKCHCGATGVNDTVEPNRLRGRGVLCVCKDDVIERSHSKAQRQQTNRDLEVARSDSHPNVMYFAAITNGNNFNNSEKHKRRASHVASSGSLIAEIKSDAKHKERERTEVESRRKENIPSEKRRHRSMGEDYRDSELDSRKDDKKSQELRSHRYSNRDAVIVHRADIGEVWPESFGMRESKRSKAADSVIEMMKKRDSERGKESRRNKVSDGREEKSRDSKHDRDSRHRDSESRKGRESRSGKDLITSEGSESKKESGVSASRDKKDLKRYTDSSSKTEVLKSKTHSKNHRDEDNINDVIKTYKSQSGEKNRKVDSDGLVVHEERRRESKSEKHLKKYSDSASRDMTKRHESRSGKDSKRNRDVDSTKDVSRRRGTKYEKGSATNKGSSNTVDIEKMMGSVSLNKPNTNKSTEHRTDRERKRQRRSGRDLINNEDSDRIIFTKEKSTGSKQINQVILSKDSASITNLEVLQGPKKEKGLKNASNSFQETEKKYRNDSTTVNVSDSRIDMERRHRPKSGHDTKRNKDSDSRTDLRRSQKQSSGKVSKKNHDSDSKTDTGKASRSGKEFKGEKESSKRDVKERGSRSTKSQKNHKEVDSIISLEKVRESRSAKISKKQKEADSERIENRCNSKSGKSLERPKDPLSAISVETLNDCKSSKGQKRNKEADTERKENRCDSKSTKSVKKPKDSLSAISIEKLSHYERYKRYNRRKESGSERKENRCDSKSAKSVKTPKDSLSAISVEKMHDHESSKGHKRNKESDSERKENRYNSKSAQSVKNPKDSLSAISIEKLNDYESYKRHKIHKKADSERKENRYDSKRGKSLTNPKESLVSEKLNDCESSSKRHKRHKEADSSTTVVSRRDTRRGKESRISKETDSKTDVKRRQTSKNVRDSKRRAESDERAAEKVRVSRSEKSVKPDKILESKADVLKGKHSTKGRDGKYSKGHRDVDSVSDVVDKRDSTRKGSSRKKQVDSDADIGNRKDYRHRRASRSDTAVSRIRESFDEEDWKKNGSSISRTAEAWQMRVSSNGLYGKSYSDYQLQRRKSARVKDKGRSLASAK